MNKKVFTKKEVNKLLLSETLKMSSKISWLLELLKANPNLRYNDLDTQQSQILQDIRSELLISSIEEWDITLAPNGKLTIDLDPKEKEWLKCQLCGTKNRYIHYIKNKLTQRVINVGSDCVEEFGAIGLEARKDRNRLVANQKKNDRLFKLLEIIPNAKSRIEKWNDVLQDQDIILSNKIEKPYKKLGEKAEKIFKSILRKDKNKNEVNALNKMFKMQEEYQQRILDYVNENKNKKFVMTQKINNWLRINRQNNHLGLLTIIKEQGNGFIVPEIAHEIDEPGFLNKLAIEYNKYLNKNHIEISQITSNGFIMSVPPFSNVFIEISNRIFTKKYCDLAFGNNIPVDLVFLLSNGKCYRKNDRDKLIDQLKKGLGSLSMRIANIDNEMSKIDIQDIRRKMYFRFDLKDFIESNKHYLYMNNYKDLQMKILKNNNSFPDRDYNNLIKREKEIMESYKEDIKK